MVDTGGKLEEAGGQQISSANSKSTNLQNSKNLLCLRTFLKCGNLWICDLEPNIFRNLQICDLQSQIFCGLKTFTKSAKILWFLLTNTYLKCSNLNIYKTKKFDQTNLQPTFRLFCYKRREKIRCFIFSVLRWKICRFAICELIT